MLGDGFGEVDEDLKEYFRDGLDWSHIRDSSEIAIEAIYDYLSRQLYSKTQEPSYPR